MLDLAKIERPTYKRCVSKHLLSLYHRQHRKLNLESFEDLKKYSFEVLDEPGRNLIIIISAEENLFSNKNLSL